MTEQNHFVPRAEVPYTPEVRDALRSRRREPHWSQQHWIPESEEERQRASRIAGKLQALVVDKDFRGQGGAILSMAESFLGIGEITESQYLETDALYRSLRQTGQTEQQRQK